ncbi:24296_t:CDS:1, partial [Racocetra persica]
LPITLAESKWGVLISQRKGTGEETSMLFTSEEFSQIASD